jgi:hypothetical protein
MPLIGDELRTILGMMPSRDRAGIARGTMADDAMRSSAAAESGNAEGAALMQQGQRPPMPGPPQVKLPPMGGPGGPPPGDIQLPNDVPTAFASGSGGGGGPAPPVPQERVVASGPAAAPPAGVATRASDVAIALLEQRNRQQKMMQLVGSLGLIANAFNRNPESQSATRSSLAGMVGGGGGAGGDIGLGDIKTIQDMKDKEAAAQAAAEIRASQIGALISKGVSPAQAAVEVDSGKAGERIGAKAEEEARVRTSLEDRKSRLRELAPDIARARGTDVRVIHAMIEHDPDAVAKLAEAEGLTKLAKEKTDQRQNERKDLLEEADVLAWGRHLKNPQTLKDAYPDEDPARIDEALQSPTQYKKLVEELTTKGQAGALDPITKDLIEKQIIPSKLKVTELANSNALENRQMQDLWRKDLKVGSQQSEMMYNLTKSWDKLTGEKLSPGMQATEKMMQAQVAGTLTTLKSLGAGTGISDADREYAMKAQGGFATTADTLKYLLFLKEKENNFRIAKHNAEVDRMAGDSRHIKNRADMLKVEYATPNRFMRDAIKADKLDTFVAEAVREGKEGDPSARAYVEKTVGPGVFDHLVKEERARQGKK